MDSDSYRLGGRIFHAGYGCPTWVPEASELGCSATAWLIDGGTVGEIDVSNVGVVIIGWRPGKASTTSRLVALVDERATAEQARALVDVFQGKLGGPLSCFALLDGTWADVLQVPISHRCDGGVCTFSVPGRLAMAIGVPGPGLPPGYSPGGDSAAPIDWALGWVGRGVEVSVTIPEQSWSFEAADCQAFFAWFAARSAEVSGHAPKGSSPGSHEAVWAASAEVWSDWASGPALRNC
jgi:hypothetical protein